MLKLKNKGEIIMNFLKKIICIAMTLVMVLTMCTVPASAAVVKLNKTSVNLPIGYKTTVKLSGTKTQAKWSVSDSDIIKVTASGNTVKITGKKSGTAYVYAKVGKKSYKCKVIVRKSFIQPSKNSLSITKGSSGTVTLDVNGSHSLSCSNSNKSVASVSFGKWNGNKIKLTVKGKKAGTAYIKVYAKGYESSTAKTITVKVKKSGTTVYYDDAGFIFGIPDDGSTSGSSSENDIASMTADVVTIVNKERKAAGASALSSDSELNKAAAIRAKELAQLFSHTRPDGRDCFTIFEDCAIRVSAAGENIAYAAPTAESVMDLWMNSPGHKSNILSDYFTKIGVGLYIDGNGTCYWVQLFGA